MIRVPSGIYRCRVSSMPNTRQFSMGGFFAPVSKFLSRLGKKTTVGAAVSLYGAVTLQASNPLWQLYGGIGHDFRSKHMLLVIHTWLLHKRLQSIANTTNGQEEQVKAAMLVQEALFDELWEDTSNRIRAQGVNELSVNKYLKEVQGYSFRCCVELDHLYALASQETLRAELPNELQKSSTATSLQLENDRKEKEEIRSEQALVEELGGVLWRMVYLRREDADEKVIMTVAKYMRKEGLSLHNNVNDMAILQGRVQFGSIPFIDGTNRSNKDVSEGEWREATAVDGKVYYWNTKTRESRWTKPN